MKKCVLQGMVVAVLAMWSFPLFAATDKVELQANSPAKDSQKKWLDTSLSFSNGYRTDHVSRNWGGLSGVPNVLSELTWKDLESYEIQGSGKALVGQLIYVRGYVDYGKILDGKNQDSDFLGNDRTLEFSRSESEVDGHVFDGSIGGGLQFRPKSASILTLSPIGGWSFHSQKLNDKKGNQTIEAIEGLVGPFDDQGTNVKYHTQWQGPWLGIDLSLEATPKLTFYTLFEYHFADFEAQDNHVLRPDLAHPKSFEEKADANGIVVGGRAEYAFTKSLTAHFDLGYQTWLTDSGRESAFAADQVTTLLLPLNEVEWSSWSFLAGVSYKF